MTVALSLGTQACDSGDIEPEANKPTFRQATASDFAFRMVEMARAARVTYDNDDAARDMYISVPNNTFIHEYQDNLSSNKVRVYEYADEAAGEFSIIVSFRGTSVTSCSDVLADVKGAMLRESTPLNPWVPGATIQGLVGRGFNDRVQRYMNGTSRACSGSACGLGLKLRIAEIMEMDGAKLDLHVVGHSLGGIASQLFSLYATRFMTASGYDTERFRIFNFAFNTPKGADEYFAGEFADNVGRFFFPFNFTMSYDPVSKLRVRNWIAIIDQPNVTDHTDLRGREIGYCPHAKLSQEVRRYDSRNHRITDDVLDRWEVALGADFADGELETVSECMKRGYEPLVLKYHQ